MLLEGKLRYQQPHSIKMLASNEALKYHLVDKEHVRQKYLAAKQSRRLYDPRSKLNKNGNK